MRFSIQCRLKYCTSRSCFMAASLLEKVPRLRRFPVCGSTLREYRRYCPDLSLRIMTDYLVVEKPFQQSGQIECQTLCKCVWSTDDVVHDLAEDIGEPIVAASVMVGKS